LDKDNDLFHHKKRFDKIPKSEFTVLFLEDAQEVMAAANLEDNNNNN
jgi:hypothetical protein